MTDGGDDSDGEAEAVSFVVRHRGGETTLSAPRGAVLRDVLLQRDSATDDPSDDSDSDDGPSLSPYTRVTARANCGGWGLCATCGVRIREGPAPEHWHDRLAARFGYPRLSCQVQVEEGMVVELDEEKRVWGRRESSR